MGEGGRRSKGKERERGVRERGRKSLSSLKIDSLPSPDGVGEKRRDGGAKESKRECTFCNGIFFPCKNNTCVSKCAASVPYRRNRNIKFRNRHTVYPFVFNVTCLAYRAFHLT